MLLTAVHEPTLAGVALAAALLFVLNHAVFKALLFLAAGSIVRATGTRDLDRLGGLVRRLPVTAALFMVGGVAIMALPPLNGFVSEWALFQVLVRAGSHAPPVLGLAMPVAVAVVALTAGLAAATFVKAIGTGTLALPRSPGGGTRGRVVRHRCWSGWASSAAGMLGARPVARDAQLRAYPRGRARRATGHDPLASRRCRASPRRHSAV